MPNIDKNNMPSSTIFTSPRTKYIRQLNKSEYDYIFFICIFLCLRVLRPTREFFTNMETSQLLVKALNFNLDSVQHTWTLSGEGSFACHTYCDRRHPFIKVISEDPWHSPMLPSLWYWGCHYLFYDLGLSRLGFEHPTFPH